MKAALWGVLVTIVLLASARATFVVGNLDVDNVGGASPLALSQWQASSLQVSADSVSWQIEAVDLRLEELIPNRFLVVQLVGETAFRPNLADVRVRFSPAANSYQERGVMRFSALTASRRPIHPGERVWLVVGVRGDDEEVVPSSGLFRWSYTSTSGSSERTFSDWALGALTASSGALGQNWEVSATTPFCFDLEARPVLPAMTLNRWRASLGEQGSSAAVFLASQQGAWSGLLRFSFDDQEKSFPELRLGENRTVMLEYIRWVNAPELRYRVSSTSDLENWQSVTWREKTELLSRERERVTLTLSEDLLPFHRVEVDWLGPENDDE